MIDKVAEGMQAPIKNVTPTRTTIEFTPEVKEVHKRLLEGVK
jgi:hypothetical protein